MSENLLTYFTRIRFFSVNHFMNFHVIFLREFFFTYFTRIRFFSVDPFMPLHMTNVTETFGAMLAWVRKMWAHRRSHFWHPIYNTKPSWKYEENPGSPLGSTSYLTISANSAIIFAIIPSSISQKNIFRNISSIRLLHKDESNYKYLCEINSILMVFGVQALKRR